MPMKSWSAARAYRFVILYAVALVTSAIFGVLAQFAHTSTIFGQPVRIALLAALGIGWPTFAPQHFDWLRRLTFAERPTSALGGALAIWAPLGLVAAAAALLEVHAVVIHDVATLWAISGMLALSDREPPGDGHRRHDPADAVRRLVASYEAVHGRTEAPVRIRS